MKRGILLLLAILLPFTAAAANMEGVRADFYVTVSENRQLTIVEELVYNFLTPSHGIIREIPTNGAEISSIRVDDEYSTSQSGGIMSIRIGSADALVSGIKDYRISYTLDPGRDRNTGYDEIYLDLYATYDETFDNISFTIALPDDVAEDRIWVTYGPYGSTRQAGFHLEDGRLITGRIDHLGPMEGVTVRVEMEEGYFAFTDYSALAFTVALVVTLILIALYTYLYIKYGRDEMPVMVPTFNPPSGLSPLDIGYLYDSRDEGKDYLAMIYYWADKGLLTIEEKGKDSFTLHKKGELDSDAPSYEKNLFDAFFKSGDDVNLDSLNLYEEMEKSVRPLLKRRYEKGERALWDAKASHVSSFSLLAVLLYALAMAFCIAANDRSFGLFAFVILAVQFVFTALILWSLNRSLPTKRQIVVKTAMTIAIGLICAVLCQGIGLSAGLGSALVRTMAFIIVAGVAVLTALACLMPKRSAYANEVLGEIFSYRDFLKEVEVEKLKALIDEDPQYFYHNLSYAIVLDLEKEWAAKCKGLFSEPASWYSGTSTAADFYFYYAMTRRMNRIVASSFAPPASAARTSFGTSSHSHSGFSGFSGGGIGGGGSRSW